MITGVILAGGQNRRMGGKSKALLPFGGETIVERQIRIMRRLCAEIILVTNQPKPFLELFDKSIRIITDYYPHKGPMSGMHAALSLGKYPDLWVVACDMPFISETAASLMWKQKAKKKCQAVIPVIDGKVHPLHGIYDKSCLPAISSSLEHGEHRLLQLLQKIQYEGVDEEFFQSQNIDMRFVTNINTPEDYDSALRMEERIGE